MGVQQPSVQFEVVWVMWLSPLVLGPTSKHNEETAELLLSQLKGMEFKEQLTDRLMNRKCM